MGKTGNALTKNDLDKWGYKLSEMLASKLELQTVQVQAEIARMDGKLTSTMKQVSKLADILTVAVDRVITHVQPAYPKKQVAALANTCGLQVETAGREMLRRRAEEGEDMFLFFVGTASTNSITWKYLSDVCRHLHIMESEEMNRILRGVCSHVTLENLQAFIVQLLKHVGVQRETLGKVCAFMEKNSASALKKQLEAAIDEAKGKDCKAMMKSTTKFLEILGDVALLPNAVQQKMESLLCGNLMTLSSSFLFMFFVWFASLKVSDKKGWMGVIRSQLQVDAQGTCARKRNAFMTSFAEIKSSSIDVPDAKLQLRVVSCFYSAIVGLLESATIEMERFILIYKRGKNDCKVEDEEFQVCYIEN